MSLILRGFGELSNDMVQISRRGVSAIAIRMFSAVNALFESLTKDPATGATRRDIAGHDHTPGNGIVIPRGSCWSMDIGEDLGAAQVWSRAIAIGEMGFYVTLIPREPNLKLFVTDGIDSALTAIHGGPCYLDARMLFDIDLTGGGTSVDIRLFNRTTNSYSNVVNLTGGNSWASFSSIPIRGGIWNEFDIEVRGNGGGGSSVNRVSLFCANIAETRDRSQPQSNGSYIYDDPAAPRP